MTTILDLDGLDGANPLGFLAAMGTLRSVARAFPGEEVRMGWTRKAAWTPRLHLGWPITAEGLCQALARFLAEDPTGGVLDLPDREGGVHDNLKFQPAELRAFAGAAARRALGGDRENADWIAALGSEANVRQETGLADDTALRTLSGSSHQHFLGTFRKLKESVDEEKLREALFGPWRYQDPQLGLRYDPDENRRYALTWTQPSKDPPKTVHGANRLAVEALPLFPTAPGRRGVQTVGFRGRNTKDTYFTWPIWEPPCSLEVVGSLLAAAELQRDEVPEEGLAARGVVEVYRCQRITTGKQRNFNPATPPPRTR